MIKNNFKTYLLSTSLMLLFFSGTCWAQSEEEMQLLRMFYKDKDLVVSSTRTEKSISQVADNITVITAEEIENMNAHTVADVLNRVPGVSVGSNQDFVTASLITIQGSEYRHVLVLVDDIPWNSIAGANAETSSIPVSSIERIEIIKGPASSAWGSSLGGVINVITKKAGTNETPSVSVSASYGKAKSQDYRGEISGKAGITGYYLYAGHQASNGLVSSRYFNGQQFLSKIGIPILQKGELGLELGYSSSKIGFGDFQLGDINSSSALRTFHANSSLKLSLAGGLDLKVSLFDLRNNAPSYNRSLGLGFYGPRGTLFEDDIFIERRTGARTQLVYTSKTQTAVLGVDYDNGKVTQTTIAGPFLQMAVGKPAKSVFTPDMDEWAVYANDSISIGNWSITPGIRYDNNNNTGTFISPSLGSTYRLGSETIIRGSVSKGFTAPQLSALSGGGLFTNPNPDLRPEKIWSYQTGIETSVIPYLWTKVSLFHHRLDDIQQPLNVGPPTFNYIIINGGKATRKGFEIEAATVPLYNISLSSGYSYVNINPPSENGSSRMYTFDAGISYDDGESTHAQLKGRYVNVGQQTTDGIYSDFIWDLNVSKKIIIFYGTTPELFFTAHNIFSGLQYLTASQINPGRWLEAGVKFHF
jgi:vitamin B12 transporter